MKPQDKVLRSWGNRVTRNSQYCRHHFHSACIDIADIDIADIDYDRGAIAVLYVDVGPMPQPGKVRVILTLTSHEAPSTSQ